MPGQDDDVAGIRRVLIIASTSWWSQTGPFTSPVNTGAEFLGWSSYTRAFYDVADVEGLRRALDQAVADSDNGR